jgi:hypothetical protein
LARDRHEVGDGRSTFGGPECGFEDVAQFAVRLVGVEVAGRTNREVPGVVSVEQVGEDAR